jgi:hypothetical protein
MRLKQSIAVIFAAMLRFTLKTGSWDTDPGIGWEARRPS